MPQPPPGLNYIPYPSLQLLRLGKPTIDLPVPEHHRPLGLLRGDSRLQLTRLLGRRVRRRIVSAEGGRVGERHSGGEGDDKDAAGGGLEDNLAEGEGEG